MPDQHNYRATELQKVAEHAYESSAVHHGKEDHLSGHERTRQAQEHGAKDFHDHEPRHKPSHHEIAALAYELWVERGSPDGSPDEDWLKAEEQLAQRNSS